MLLKKNAYLKAGAKEVAQSVCALSKSGESNNQEFREPIFFHSNIGSSVEPNINQSLKFTVQSTLGSDGHTTTTQLKCSPRFSPLNSDSLFLLPVGLHPFACSQHTDCPFFVCVAKCIITPLDMSRAYSEAGGLHMCFEMPIPL